MLKRITVLLMGIITSLTVETQANEALTNACRKGDLEAVKKAVADGADVNALRADGAPILAEALFSPEVTQYLIDQGADPNGGTFPALMIVAGSYSVEVMKVLLNNGADPNKPQVKTTVNPIQMMINMEKAKKKPNKKLLKQWEEQLAAQGGGGSESKVSILENTINTTNCIPCVQLLLEKGADPKYLDAVGNDLITNSVTRWMDISQNFVSFKTMLETKWGYVVPDWFLDRIKKGSAAEEVKALIAAGADPNYLNVSNNNTPLLAALGAKNIDGVKVLIENGADVTVLTPTNKDALSLAVEFGDLDLIKMIVDKGADVTRETWGLDQASGQYAKGFTPLTIAVVNDKLDVAKYLIEAGSKPKEGVSGYHVSKKTGCPYKLKNKTAIYYAVENNNLEMLQMLMDNFNRWNMTKMEMKQPDNSYTLDAGSVTIEITSCWKISGVYTPSSYAKKIGHKEAATLLKGKGL